MRRIWSSQDLEQMLSLNDRIRLQEQVRSRVADLQPIPTGVKSKLSCLDEVRCVLFDIYGTLLISDTGDILTANEPSEDEIIEGKLSVPDRQALFCLPELLRISLPENFVPSQVIKQRIKEQHQRQKSTTLIYPEVDIISLWHEIFLSQLNEDIHHSVSPFILARFALEYELLHNQVQLMPGVLELLHWLVARGFYLGIISNAQFYTPLILSALLNLSDLSILNILRDLSFWSYLHACSKPQAELFTSARYALGRHNIQAKEVLFLGNDMHNDIWGATKAGFRTALFAGDQRSLRLRKDMVEIANTEPDIVITELGQLKSVLQSPPS